ncbi:DUF1330 domain-containing protein [Vibrio sp. WXL103]|uniref:DUF1330 domain-containing protein n=1 Tax=Vibrio sp. WXL103 TaxID=3450710 RepID=UPI003EC53CA4
MNQIPAYLVCSSFMPEGHGSLQPYGEAIHPLMEKYGGQVLIAGDTHQQLDHFEGQWNENARFTLFRFPSMEALQAFWHSEEYQAHKHLRTDVIPPNFTFATEGFDPQRWEQSQQE